MFSGSPDSVDVSASGKTNDARVNVCSVIRTPYFQQRSVAAYQEQNWLHSDNSRRFDSRTGIVGSLAALFYYLAGREVRARSNRIHDELDRAASIHRHTNSNGELIAQGGA